MRVIYLLVLLLLLGVVGTFAVQNRELISLRFLDWSIACPGSLLIAIAYLLGMLSGWTVLGFLQRSMHQVMDRPSP